MSWDYSLSEKAIKDLRKIGPEACRRVIAYLDERVRGADNPRQYGKALRGELGEFWRYRVGDCRILCSIRDTELIVLVVKVGHRRDVYV